MKKSMLEYFSDIFSNSKKEKNLKKEVLNTVNDEYTRYKNMPQVEKDLICIELARSLGCQEHDLKSCSMYLKDYIRGLQ